MDFNDCGQQLSRGVLKFNKEQRLKDEAAGG